MPIHLLLALAVPFQEARTIQPVAQASQTNDEFALPELQDSAVPS